MAHSFGLIRQTPDKRDFKLYSPRSVTDVLPEEFDLSVSDSFGKVPQLDQGALGSCGPNTADEDIMNDQLVQGLPLTPASRLFIYWTTRYLQGSVGTDSGVENRTLLKALNQFGFCAETMWPYRDDIAHMTQKPNADCFNAALANRITSYAGVTISLSQLQGALFTVRRPVLFGFSVYRQIQSPQADETGVLTLPAPGEQPIGGHDVSLVGWSNSRGMFKFRNHWMKAPGVPWGDNGYGWIPYDYACNPNLASDCWVINAVPGGIVPPPLPPKPPVPPPTPPPTPPPHPTNTSLLKNVASLFGWHSHEPASAADPISFYK